MKFEGAMNVEDELEYSLAQISPDASEICQCPPAQVSSEVINRVRNNAV